MNKIWQLFTWIVLLASMFIIILVTFWSIYPYKTVEFFNKPFPIENENSTVVSGGRLRYIVNYCKYSKENPLVTRYFVDGVILETPKMAGGLELGCKTVISDIYVPKAVPAGTYKLKIAIQYRPNPIRRIDVINYTEPFTIVK